MKNLDYTALDVDMVQPYIKTAVHTNQISGTAQIGMLRTLRLALNAKHKTPEALTIKDTCNALKCSRPTIYVLIKNGKLKPIYLTSKAVRILKSSVDDLLLGRGGPNA